jgi:predicted RNA binding protein YcfA (HicA-like mRNA interferase family)
VGKYEELLQRILSGTSDANIRFDELVQLLSRLGFVQRVRGSHHIFRKSGIEERINLQQDGNKAKPYQVRQVRSILLRHKLGGLL